MKKMIVPVVLGLIIGLGGSMAARMILAKEPASLEESLVTAMGDEVSDSGAAVLGAHPDSAAVFHGDSIAPQLADSLLPPVAVAETTHVARHPAAGVALAVGGVAASGPAAAAAANAAAPVLPEGALTSAELAKLFAAMQARDAAKVLEQMDDYEVQVILGALGNREAAAILSSLPPERAAVISRAVILGERRVR